jgi:hypothetical protein
MARAKGTNPVPQHHLPQTTGAGDLLRPPSSDFSACGDSAQQPQQVQLFGAAWGVVAAGSERAQHGRPSSGRGAAATGSRHASSKCMKVFSESPPREQRP